MPHSFTISLNSNSSELSADFLTPLELDDGGYECALVYFKTFNSIPNVDKSNHLFHFGDKILKVPEGNYELQDIIKNLYKQMIALAQADGDMETGGILELEANVNTSKCLVFSPKYEVYFNKKNSIAPLLGFSPQILKPKMAHWSDKQIDILITHTIRIECNIVEGSFINNEPSHVIHEFSPTVPPGYQIVETPSNIIYLPIKRNTIQEIKVRIVNERGDLVNFLGENISLRLHIRKVR